MSRFGLIALFALLLVGCQEREYEEKEREIGYKGVARVNRLLAAERLAKKMGMEAASYSGAPSLLPPDGTTLVLPMASLQSEGVLSEMEDWVLEGGNLVAFLSLSEENLFFDRDRDDEFEDARPFLDYFAFDVIEATYEPSIPDVQDEEEGEDNRKISEVSLGEYEATYTAEFQTGALLRDTDEVGSIAAPMHRYDYGEGSLTVLATAEPFRNRNLGKAEHARLLWDILGMGEEKGVWFVHSTRISFFKLLWQEASAALWLMFVTLVLLIWWAARGFGPRFLRGADPTAQLDEHLEASGAFFLKHRAEGEVIAHLREKLFRRLARATNLPFNASSAELLARGRELGILSQQESAALLAQHTDKTLLGLLQTLRNLDKKL